AARWRSPPRAGCRQAPAWSANRCGCRKASTSRAKARAPRSRHERGSPPSVRALGGLLVHLLLDIDLEPRHRAFPAEAHALVLGIPLRTVGNPRPEHPDDRAIR